MIEEKPYQEIKEKRGFNFPLSNGGGIQGINDAGVETFKGNPNKYLAKEIIQNSLDAKSNYSSEPVKVIFKLHEMKVDDIPYNNQLKEAFEGCKEFWEKENDKKTLKFIDQGLSILGKEYIKVLEIADYNTTGLRGARQEKNNVFAKLVADSGVSNKKEGSGGSFGIGKNAPYTCSTLRTVIYSTLDDENVRAIQGVSRLLSHKNKENRLTQGKGFLGIEEENQYKDIVNQPFVDNDKRKDIEKYIENKEFVRNIQGTSLYILGYTDGGNWEKEIILAILDFYMIAIADGKLEVQVEDNIVKAETLEEIIKKYASEIKDTYIGEYYRAYKQKGDKTLKIEEDFEGMGKLELYLLLEEESCHKKIAYIRNNGMKIIDKDRFRVMCKFDGILIFRGKEINEFIRSLENPSHDRIEIERYYKPSEAKDILSKLFNWIKDKINEATIDKNDEIVEMNGLGKYLPIDSENKFSADFKETLKKKLKNTKMKRVEKLKKARKIKGEDGDEELEGTGGGKIDIDSNGDGNKRGNEPEVKKIKGKENLKAITVKKSRVIASSKGKYKVIIESGNSGRVYIGINLVGEVGAEAAKLISARDIQEQIDYKVEKNYFGPVDFKKAEMKKFEIQVEGKSIYSMEVETSADNR